MQTLAYRPEWTQSVKQWALDGQTVFYGDEECQQVGKEKKFPAIIDTGSSNIGVPGPIYSFLKEKWFKAVDKLDCITDDNFCQVMTPCAVVSKQLKPLVFHISGQAFELKPDLYLHQAEGNKCQFAIHQNELKGSSSGLFLIGDVILRHLYQVYDFENETISLGVNTHSQNDFMMYPIGQRPEEAPKLNIEQILASPEVEARMDTASRFV